MRIGIDGRVFKGNTTGIGQYVLHICHQLDSLLPDAEFHVYNRDPITLPVKNKRWILHSEKHSLKRLFKNILWQKLFSGSYCKRDKIDVYWGAGSFLPLFIGSLPTVVTVYDLVHEIEPQTMYIFNLGVHRLFFTKDVRRATKVTTISQGTANRLKHYTGRNTDAIVYPSCEIYNSQLDNQTFLAHQRKWQISQPYFLSVATWEPRKNLKLLVETFIEMKHNGELSQFKLVLSGGRGWGDKKLAELLENNPYTHSIIPVGYVSRDELHGLYANAQALVFPSAYEGFGMPVLEARFSGTPVITTDLPEIREAGGEDCTYIQPTSQGLRSALLEMSHITKTINTDTIQHPTWKESSKILVQVLLDALTITK